MSAQNPAQYSSPVEYLKQLIGLGLWYSRPMPCFGGGVWILKPVEAGGNSIPGYTASGVAWVSFDEIEELPTQLPQPESDAAMLALFKDHLEDRWVVFGVDCAGGMGPADFIGLWTTLDEAIADINDFYFGDS
ncbi:MAG: hypothetical protein JST89_13955 [Cyanobacteria bacterium SZAS-4]|nr:hypothetical protein [Cyanobacteria bacterium SZAS-4]